MTYPAQQETKLQEAKLLDTTLQALSIVVSHSDVTEDLRTICILLEASKSVRAVMQQAATCTLEVEVNASQFYTEQCHSTLKFSSSFTNWMLANHGLLKSLDVCNDPFDASEAGAMAAQLVSHLAATLRHCYGGSTRESRASWGLRHFCTSLPVSEALLAALPSASLLSLDILVMATGINFSPLAHLRNLQRLYLAPDDDSKDIPTGGVPALANLKQLTSLTLLNPTKGDDLGQLPRQLEELEVEYSLDWQHVHFMLHDIVGLTRFSLSLAEQAMLVMGCTLPPSLQYLTLDCEAAQQHPMLEAVGVSRLTGLRSLHLSYAGGKGPALHMLAELPQLSYVHFTCSVSDEQAVNAASSWQFVPQLHDLSVQVFCYISAQDTCSLAKHLGSVTQLTRLEVMLHQPAVDGGGRALFGKYLTNLTGLRDLSLNIGPGAAYDRWDALHLTALGSLACLDVHVTADYVDPMVLTLLPSYLTSLSRLALHGDSSTAHNESVAHALGSIGRLPKLESLVFPKLDKHHARLGLSMLTGLTQLSYLDGFKAAGRAALDEFWVVVRLGKPPGREAGR